MRDNKFASVRQPKVLLVDPHPAELERVASGLRQLDFRVVAVGRLDGVFPLYRAFAPDVVVIAGQAPQFECIPVVRRLRRLEAAATPFLYIVDAPDPQLRQVCLTKGLGLDALARPVDVAELGAKIVSLLSWRDAVVHQTRLAMEAATPALHDATTGLYNRRYLLSLIAHETKRVERAGGAFTVAVGTIQPLDGRTLSRRTCARLLTKAAESLAGMLRDTDVLARLGARTFGILMPDLGAEHVEEVSQRLHSRLAGVRVELPDGPLKLGAVVGTASFPDVLGAPQTLLARAQAAQTSRRAANDDLPLLVDLRAVP